MVTRGERPKLNGGDPSSFALNGGGTVDWVLQESELEVTKKKHMVINPPS